MLNDNDDLPSAGMDPFAPPVKQNNARSRSSWSRWLIIAGGLSLLLGCIVGIGATAVQYGNQEDWQGFYAFITICPVPCAAFGLILLIAGGLPLTRKNQIEDA